VHSTRSGWRALVAALSAAILLVALVAAPAFAVTDGKPDGDGHPYVGLMTAHAADGDYMHRCTGTLISSTVFVTAGHCTYGADYAVVYFEAGPIEPDPDYDPVSRSCDDPDIEGYPCAGGVTGEVYTHPQYDDDLFYLYDLGVVVLDEPVILDEYGELPELNELDDLRSGTRFTSVTASRSRSPTQPPGRTSPSVSDWSPIRDCCRSTPRSPARRRSCCPTTPTRAAPASAIRAVRTSLATRT
jgi:hypothetical protein